jgi:hypothetical protein
MTRTHDDDVKLTPRDTAESEEREASERVAAERGLRGEGAREQDDPREEDGWSQPESSAQKGAAPDEG